jgi:hypothetical protein
VDEIGRRIVPADCNSEILRALVQEHNKLVEATAPLVKPAKGREPQKIVVKPLAEIG